MAEDGGVKSFSLTAYRYQTGQGTYRFKGNPPQPGFPAAIRDLYIEKWAMGGKPPRDISILITWDEQKEDTPHDDGEESI